MKLSASPNATLRKNINCTVEFLFLLVTILVNTESSKIIKF